MTPTETVKRFRKLLLPNSQEPTPRQVWEAYKKFAHESVDCADDFLLVQVGDSNVLGDSYLDFCREFRLVDGNAAWSEQFHAEFKTELPAKLGCKPTDCGSYQFDDLDKFFAAVEAMPEFQAGLVFEGWKFSIYHTGV